MNRPSIPPERTFMTVGSGMLIRRLCAQCGCKTSQAGGGYRKVQGVKQYVCATCRAGIDGDVK